MFVRSWPLRLRISPSVLLYLHLAASRMFAAMAWQISGAEYRAPFQAHILKWCRTLIFTHIEHLVGEVHPCMLIVKLLSATLFTEHEKSFSMALLLPD